MHGLTQLFHSLNPPDQNNTGSELVAGAGDSVCYYSKGQALNSSDIRHLYQIIACWNWLTLLLQALTATSLLWKYKAPIEAETMISASENTWLLRHQSPSHLNATKLIKLFSTAVAVGMGWDEINYGYWCYHHWFRTRLSISNSSYKIILGANDSLVKLIGRMNMVSGAGGVRSLFKTNVFNARLA